MAKPQNPDGSGPDMTFFEKFFPSRNTHVYFCDFTTGELNCRIAASDFYRANGITHNKDFSLIFVADSSLDRSVRVFERDKATNELTQKSYIYMSHMIDNLKYDDLTGHVYGGTLNNLYKEFVKLDFNETSEGKGGTVELQYDSKGSWKTRQMITTSKLNGVANGMRMHNVLVMGSWGYPGLLACPIDEKVPFSNQGKSDL